MEQQTADTRAKVQSWLLGEGWSLTEKNHDDAVWLLEARDGGGRHIVTGQKKGATDQVLLEGVVGIADAHQEQFAALPAEVRQELLWELRFALLNMGVEFSGVQEPFNRVMVGQRIYHDGLTQDRYLQRVSQVRSAIIAVIWTIARRLGLGAPAAEAPPQGVN
jgi:hypothetical protein